MRNRDALFTTYMGSVSDKHLRAYLDETEFRVNHQGVSALDRVSKLAGRFPRVPPATNDGTKGPKSPRSPLWFLGRSNDELLT